jgi:serine/threonine protein kinase
LRTEKATLRTGGKIDFVTEMIGDGAMKEVYFTPDRKSVVCFYKDLSTGGDPLRIQRLENILGKYNPTVLRSEGGAAANEVDASYFRELYCWPTAIVTAPRFGLVTPTYPNNFFFDSGPDFIKGKDKNGMRFIGRKNRALLEKMAPAELGSWINYFGLCIQMARAVARLHNAGLAHSDLSPNNVLVDPTKGRAIVIDIDSLVVPQLFPPDVAGTKGYIAPEVLSTLSLPFHDPKRKHPSARTDEHALAVLIYQYLLRRHPLEGRRIPPVKSAEEQELLAFGSQALYCEHPQDVSNRPEETPYIPCTTLGPLLTDLFKQAFIDGIRDPNRRPSANDWVKALVKTWDLLQPCSNPMCSEKWYVLHDEKHIRCTFCSKRPTQPIPVLKFRSEGLQGQWLPDGQVNVFHNLQLFRWHCYSRSFPGPTADKTPMAYCVWHQGQWLMINQNLTTLTSPGGNRVPAGQAVALSHGAKFRLAANDYGRMAEVELLQP